MEWKIEVSALEESHSQLLVESAERVANDVQLMTELFHYAVDACGVLQHVHTLGIGVVAHREWPFDGLSKLPEAVNTKALLLILRQTMRWWDMRRHKEDKSFYRWQCIEKQMLLYNLDRVAVQQLWCCLLIIISFTLGDWNCKNNWNQKTMFLVIYSTPTCLLE